MDDLPEVGFVPTDKLLHAAVFGGLTWLLSRALRFCLPQAALSKCLWLGALGASLLGALLELCQALVPYRSADPLDWVADSVGAGLALLVSLAFVRLVRMPVEG
ncbi:MAG: VanZ family protein [Pseudomonadota bacterium]